MAERPEGCPLERTLDVIAGRWRGLVLRELFRDGTLRFGELQRRLTGISQRVLTQELRELERLGVVHREVYQQVPPKVEYSLTPIGKSLSPVLDAMNAWGAAYLKKVGGAKS